MTNSTGDRASMSTQSSSVRVDLVDDFVHGFGPVGDGVHDAFDAQPVVQQLAHAAVAEADVDHAAVADGVDPGLIAIGPRRVGAAGQGVAEDPQLLLAVEGPPRDAPGVGRVFPDPGAADRAQRGLVLPGDRPAVVALGDGRVDIRRVADLEEAPEVGHVEADALPLVIVDQFVFGLVVGLREVPGQAVL